MLGFERFSLARFSLGSEENVYPITQTFGETLNAVAGIAIPVETTAFYSDVLRGECKGAIMVPTGFTAVEEFSVSAAMQANIALRQKLDGALFAEVGGAKDIWLGALLSDSLAAAPYGGKDMPMPPISLGDGLGGAVEGGKNIVSTLLTGAVMTALTSATTQSTEEVTMTVTLPPGGTLRVDSDTYRALLDGENVLHLQSGDWIMLTRTLQYLDVESATGGDLSGSVIYTERYL